MVFLRIIAIAACIFCVEGRCASGDDTYENLKGRIAAQHVRISKPEAGKPDLDKIVGILDDWLKYAHAHDTDLEKLYKDFIHTIRQQYLSFKEKLINKADIAELKESLNAFVSARKDAIVELKNRAQDIKESKIKSRFKRYATEILEKILVLHRDLSQMLRDSFDRFQKDMASKT